MSKMISPILLTLGILFIVCAGIGGYFFVQNNELQGQNTELQTQVADFESQIVGLKKQNTDLDQQVKDARRDKDQATRDRDDVQRRMTDTQSEATRLKEDVRDLQRDQKDFESRIATIRKERDDFAEKLKSRPVEVQEKIVEKIVERVVPAAIQPRSTGESATGDTTIVVENSTDEDYWAGVNKQKAALEVELGSLKQKVSEAQLKVADFQKANSDLEIELGRLKNEREEILRKIKYGEDLADNLAIELVRSRNEQRIVSDRADKVSAENQTLRGDIKQLTSTKVALEKSIARLTDDKNSIEKKLVETESIIQSRIDEIWQIKKDVDARFDGSKASTGSVELAPIVVNANVEPARMVAAESVRKVGNIVSINDPNNFVIINLGEKDNIRVGDAYKVYRDGKSIGAVSVIQVRKDISAADIKQKTVPFRAGDQVR